MGQKVADVAVFFGADRADHLWIIVQPISCTADKRALVVSLGSAQVATLHVIGNGEACPVQGGCVEVHMQD